ncbi:MAG: hypothetical protein ACK4G4_11520 [Thermus sp.]|uniref:hypothetical protein n=1 Tax=Thermus sp. TaxID=275 RepID=UPI003919EFA8
MLARLEQAGTWSPLCRTPGVYAGRGKSPFLAVRDAVEVLKGLEAGWPRRKP